MSGSNGSLRIAEDVVITVAEAAISEIKGVECPAGRGGFISSLFFKEHPVTVKKTGDVIEINAEVIVKRGVNAVLAAEKIQEAVKADIQSMTGITVSKVNVLISGISLDS